MARALASCCLLFILAVNVCCAVSLDVSEPTKQGVKDVVAKVVNKSAKQTPAKAPSFSQVHNGSVKQAILTNNPLVPMHAPFAPTNFDAGAFLRQSTKNTLLFGGALPTNLYFGYSPNM
eukprot:c5522_g1_i2.p2 GENE.c5522_g1_i2~~c5522_g1_i2.p2  ORF type:complete len:119 (-),score=31.99 c5522_g1_i2:623-979(-)